MTRLQATVGDAILCVKGVGGNVLQVSLHVGADAGGVNVCNVVAVAHVLRVGLFFHGGGHDVEGESRCARQEVVCMPLSNKKSLNSL